MKKELFAAITIMTLMLAALYNILHMKKLSEEISSQIELTEQYCVIGNYDSANESLSKALTLWLNADGYTHIFIRHSEIDSTSDAFYEALSSIQDQSPSAFSAIAKIKYHLSSIRDMERITTKSVF